MVRRDIMVIAVAVLAMMIVGVGGVLYFYYPSVLGIVLPGDQFSQIEDNGNYYSLRVLSETLDSANMTDNYATFAIFSTNQFGRINWQSANVTYLPAWWNLGPDATQFVLHGDRLYLCFIADQL